MGRRRACRVWVEPRQRAIRSREAPSGSARAGGLASGPQSGMAGRGGAMAGMMVAGKPGPAADRKDGDAAATVRQIGSKTFYWKHERWIDSTVTQEEDEKATVLTQLSDDYFSLARTQKAGNNQYLSLDEPVTVKLEGKVYRIEPPKKEAAR